MSKLPLRRRKKSQWDKSETEKDLINFMDGKLPEAEHKIFLEKLFVTVLSAKLQAELALMRGDNVVLSEKSLLLEHLYMAISQTNRPVHREIAYNIVKQALDKYLGIPFPRPKGKRRRRKLLHAD